MIAEPIEIAIVVLAGLAFCASVYLWWGSLQTARTAEAEGKCEAVRTLAWGRVRNESLRGLVVLLVLAAGYVQVTSPPPMTPGPNRLALQVTWAIIAGINLVMSVLNERMVRRVVSVIERERAAGRMA